jgi:hypothetical protein
MDDFVDKIELLIKDGGLRDDMGKEGRKWAMKNCHAPLIVDQWRKVFEDYGVNRATVNLNDPVH